MGGEDGSYWKFPDPTEEEANTRQPLMEMTNDEWLFFTLCRKLYKKHKKRVKRKMLGERKRRRFLIETCPLPPLGTRL